MNGLFSAFQPNPEDERKVKEAQMMMDSLQQQAQQPTAPQSTGIFGGLKNYFANPVNTANLAASMNSMVINPNDFYDQNARDVKAMQLQKMQQQQAAEQQNQTLKYFQDNGRPDLVEAVQNGYSVKDAMNEFRQSQQGGQTPAAMQTFNAMTAGLSPEQIEQARLVNLGLQPRAATDQIVDVGGVPHIMDRGTGQLMPVKMEGQDVTAESVAGNQSIIDSQKKLSDANTQKIIDAESSIQTSQSLLNTLDAMLGKDREAVSSRTGGLQGRLPVLTEKGALGQSYIDQVAGKTFMQAYQGLKGGGQITEVEGRKAQDAIARLGTQTMSDSDYINAIRELRDIASASLYRAQGLLSQSKPVKPDSIPAEIWQKMSDDEKRLF
ncbi:hypothetical protein N9M91_02130 [Porticoccaceae bacterium]|nr:hypothetical protein [Porticoccaceae bacterium]